MTKFPAGQPCAAAPGFTLIELLVTLALAAILASLAAPAVRDFLVRSKLTNLGNEFTASVLKARNEAVNRNTCVTLCMSGNADDSNPKCSSDGSNWLVGWIAFLNPACNGLVDAPAAIDLLLARPASGADYKLNVQGRNKKMTFNPRGAPAPTDVDQFNLIFLDSDDALTRKYAFNICMDGLGRTRTIPADKTCASYE